MDRIALKMLFGDATKYLGLVLGVAFTTLLINQQVGIFIGLLSRAGSIIVDAPEADIWVMDPGVKNLDTVFPLRDTELPRLRGIPGVSWALPLFKGGGTVRTAEGVIEGTIVIGVDDVSLAGVPQKTLAGRTSDLRQVDAVALDPEGFRRIWPGEPLQVGRVMELNDRRAVVVAIVQASPSFVAGSVVYTRYSQALQYTNNGRNQMSFVIAKAAPGFDAAEVAQAIVARTKLKAVTAAEFRWQNIQVIINETGIPISIATVVTLGIIVGVVVVGLLFHLFVVENMREFATLKAIGVRSPRLFRMVFLQASVAGIVGYSLGLFASALFFETAGRSPTFRGFFLPWQVAAGTAVLAACIIVVSILFSFRRLLFVDPAIVFRG